jgi:hypothetical protein
MCTSLLRERRIGDGGRVGSPRTAPRAGPGAGPRVNPAAAAANWCRVARSCRAGRRGRHGLLQDGLSLDKFDGRVSEALVAVTRGALDRLVDDLPPFTEADPVRAAADPVGTAAESAARVLSWIVLAVGVSATPVSFSSPWGAVLGLVAVVLGVFALAAPGRLPQLERAATAAGMVLGLMPTVFFVMLFLVLTL